MHYVVVGRQESSAALPFEAASIVADGETMSFELPWTFGALLVVRVDDTTALDDMRVRVPAESGINAFAVEGLAEPGAGEAIFVAAHMMRDMERFRPYAEAVPAVIAKFGCRYLARAGTVTPIAGTFIPDRAIVMEFATADAAVAFYTSDEYAPLLKIRLATTEPHFVLMARRGRLPESAWTAASNYLHSRRA